MGRFGHAPKLCPSLVTGIAVRVWPTAYVNSDSYPNCLCLEKQREGSRE